MKKTIFTLGIALVALAGLVGCSYEDQPSRMSFFMLTKMMTTNDVTNESKTSTYTFRQVSGTTPDPNNPNIFSTYPEVVREQIEGDTLSRIEYSYNVKEQTVTASRYHINGNDVYVDSLGLTEKGLAATVLRDGQSPAPYWITYNDLRFRDKVGDTTLVSDPDHSGLGSGAIVYRSATVDGELVAEYFYSSMPNFIKLQQHTIPGAPYYWSTERFGAQSTLLLDYSKIKENGDWVRYDFSYTLNSVGLVAEERISRNGQPFMTNKYAYTTGVIEW